MKTVMSNGPAAAWTDSKRYLWLLGPMVPLIAALGLFAYAQTGSLWGCWLAPLVLYGLVPLLDWLVGADSSNPPESAVASLEADRYYRAILYLFVPLQLAVTVYGTWLVATTDPSALALFGIIWSVGGMNGIAIVSAHELGHKKDSRERWLAKLTLAPAAYGHFFVEHNRGHHKNVATPGDPASSMMGESFWRFLPRTMINSLRSAWHLEGERLARLGKSPWTLSNDNLNAWLMTVLLFGALTAVLGLAVLPFLLLQAFFAAAMLEVVNYLEHYGLLRQKDASGRYVRCEPEHSWNSNHIVTNLFLYQLQRHSDHHAHPTRRYQTLRHFDNSPQLPSGYASMLLLAYIPPLWFRVMDPLVAQHYGGDLSRAHLLPAARERLVRRYHLRSSSADAPRHPA